MSEISRRETNGVVDDKETAVGRLQWKRVCLATGVNVVEASEESCFCGVTEAICDWLVELMARLWIAWVKVDVAGCGAICVVVIAGGDGIAWGKLSGMPVLEIGVDMGAGVVEMLRLASLTLLRTIGAVILHTG